MQRRRGRVIRLLALLAGLGLAIAATAALVLTEDLQLLRLAVVAALWAFLIAAFLTGQRRDPAAAEQTIPGTEVELRRTHELELQREVAKRREFELLTEVRLRREIETGLRADLGALRGDLDRLRHDILERWDGELRVERIAVRAESTRFSGMGALTALHDQARRRQDESDGRRAVEQRHGYPDPAGRDAGTYDTASTVEFSIVPSGPVPADPEPGPAPAPAPAPTGRLLGGHRISDDTGPVYGLAPPARAVPPPPSAAPPPATAPQPAAVPRRPAEDPEPVESRHRSRHGAEEGVGAETAGVDASALLARLRAESAAGQPPRRRRARAEGDPNDVLTRVLGGG